MAWEEDSVAWKEDSVVWKEDSVAWEVDSVAWEEDSVLWEEDLVAWEEDYRWHGKLERGLSALISLEEDSLATWKETEFQVCHVT